MKGLKAALFSGVVSLLHRATADPDTRGAPSCSQSTLKAFQLPSEVSIVSAAHVEEGSAYGEGEADIPYPTNPTDLPELCALIVNVTTSPSSFFRLGIFLPAQWNSKFLVVGNGAFSGGINWLDMGSGVQYGHAVVSTDTGHNSSGVDTTWALNAEERRKDFGYRSIHGAATVGKSIVEQYYGKPITYSYYSGASTGGRQGLKEVQLYPDSFDGALIGAPAWWTSHMQPWTTKVATYNLPVGAPNNIPVPLFAILGEEVIRQCDALDGLVDGIVSSPEECQFDISTLRCTAFSSNASSCFTAEQVQTVEEIYADYLAQGKFAFPGFEYGSEPQFPFLLGSPAPNPLGDGYVQHFVLDDPDWTWRAYNDSIVWLAEARDPGGCTADHYDLSPFRERGGKMILYHGLADSLIPPGSSRVFYDKVVEAMGGAAALQSWLRFFEVPGMQHVSNTAVDAPWYFAGAAQAGRLGTAVYSTPGFPDAQHDVFLALMDWVEQGKPVDQIVATTWNNPTDPASGVLRQRPLCPYPQKQTYIGGDEGKPASFACA